MKNNKSNGRNRIVNEYAQSTIKSVSTSYVVSLNKPYTFSWTIGNDIPLHKIKGNSNNLLLFE